ncbi:hypothetical protein SFC65_19935 [Priestia filamentosa]|uniref:hypothetical protein n=1 Tax=Priestia filamentosa TaxID=1402861 RepID=UPI0039826073
MIDLDKLDEIKSGLDQLCVEYKQLGYEADIDLVMENEQAIILNVIDGKDDYFVKVHFETINVSENIYVEERQSFVNEVSLTIRVTFKINDEQKAHPLGESLIHNFTEKTGLQIPEENLMSSTQDPASNLVH